MFIFFLSICLYGVTKCDFDRKVNDWLKSIYIYIQYLMLNFSYHIYIIFKTTASSKWWHLGQFNRSLPVISFVTYNIRVYKHWCHSLLWDSERLLSTYCMYTQKSQWLVEIHRYIYTVFNAIPSLYMYCDFFLLFTVYIQ
jgi:hypothetical protein